MITYTNECVDCPQGCVNCGRKRMRTVICDCCKEEIDVECGGLYTLPDYDDLCESCLLHLCRKKDVGE